MPGDYNSLSPHQNWQSLGGNGFHGYNNQGGQGVPIARGELDSLRIGTGRVPSAEYPDGYLGTIRSRRDDRLLDSLKSRVGDKKYQRGVHKGEKIGVDHYYWSMDFSDQTGIKRQMKAKYDGRVFVAERYAPDPILAPAPHLVNDGKSNLKSDAPVTLDGRRLSQMDYLKPSWR
jgi:hypothetical protein